MTRIVKMTSRCNSCGATYAGLLGASFDPGSDDTPPWLKPLQCPSCNNPWTHEQKLNSESIIGNPSALEGYDEVTNSFPNEPQSTTTE